MRFKAVAWLAVSLVFSGNPNSLVAEEIWRSPSLDEGYLLIEKPLSSAPADPAGNGSSEGIAALPPDVVDALGPKAEDYDAFVVTYVPPSSAADLASKLDGHRLAYSTDQPRSIHLSWHSFEPDEPADRRDPALSAEIGSVPVPHLFIMQFAYPVRAQWLDELASCGVERLGYFQHRTFLVRAPDADAILSCGVKAHLAWVDSYYSTDRLSADFLAFEGAREYWLQFAPGTDLAQKMTEVSGKVEVVDSYASEDGSFAFLRVRSDATELVALADTDADFMTATRAGVGEPSDERQGQIIAGNHNGTAVTSPGYKSWLSARGLLTTSNQQTVAVIDEGYDDGQHPSTHHPDLENPDRLVGIDNFFIPTTDQTGHGTMVVGIIAGDGSTGSGATDSGGFHYGTGISPKSKVYVATVGPFTNLSRQQLAHNASESAGARIVNHSWDERDPSVSSAYTPVNDYDAVAQFMDQRVIDMSTAVGGSQPTTIVFSAGNYRQNCNGLNYDTVASPATAKNVIAVGATRSYRPAPDPPLACRPCTDGTGALGSTNFGRPPNEDATNVGRVADFSSRGRFFTTYPAASGQYANTVRIKPDLVAPGVRVFSTVPYQFAQYATTPDDVNACIDFYPASPLTYHSYGTGTSFAAPVVTGVAALARKWFLDQGTSPSPSLLKAALISTADTLGGSNGPHDHRPSNIYGWGRVNLGRFVDSVPKFWVSDSASLAVQTGQSRSWTRQIGVGSSPTYIVLVWSDPASSPVGTSQVGLVNDLLLKVDGGRWRGNFFNENITGVDDGYSYDWNIGTGANDTINNVEAVFIPPNTYASNTSITISVVGQNVTSSTAQQFALYAYNVKP